MTIVQSIALGTLQGLTEFLPISSSGHLVIIPSLFKWEEPSVVFDVTLHFGTLLALLIYFRSDVIKLLSDFFKSLIRLKLSGKEERIPWLILIATVPAVIIGLFFKSPLEALFSHPSYVSIFLMITGLFMILSEFVYKKIKTDKKSIVDLGPFNSFFIGIAQAVAIIPGFSRSGWSISTGLLVDLERYESAKFSFLLSIPAIGGAFLYKAVTAGGSLKEPLICLIIGLIVSFITGYLAILYFLRFLKKYSLHIFAYYCLLFGVISFLILYV